MEKFEIVKINSGKDAKIHYEVIALRKFKSYSDAAEYIWRLGAKVKLKPARENKHENDL